MDTHPSISINKNQIREDVFISSMDIEAYTSNMTFMKNTIALLVNKVEKLENELSEVKKRVFVQRKKIPVLGWLQENAKPSNSFVGWINEFDINEKDMIYMCEHKPVKGLINIFMRMFPLDTMNSHPIRTFNQKKNVFYIYRKDKVWVTLSQELFERTIHTICIYVQGKYIEWCDTHAEAIKNDPEMYETNQKYLENLMHRPSNSVLVEKIKGRLYEYLKYSLREIIKYEFDF